MLKLWRILSGPQPVLRLIAVLLVVIAVLLYQTWRAVRAIDIPNGCGEQFYNPCTVTVVKND